MNFYKSFSISPRPLIPNNATKVLYTPFLQQRHQHQKVLPAKIIFVDKFDPLLSPSLVSWTSFKSWIVDKVRSVQALQKIRKTTKSSNQEMITEAKMLYQTMNESIAKRDLKKLQESTSEGMFVNVRPSIPPASSATYEWKCEFTRSPKIVQARVAQTPQGDQLGQITIRLDTNQVISFKVLLIVEKHSLTILDKVKQTKEQSVHEFIVLDRWISVAESRWRISGKIE
jgi:hypothetical protein